jgi:hypothetical protein
MTRCKLSATVAVVDDAAILAVASLLELALRAWRELLKASVVGAVALLLASKLKAPPLSASQMSALPKDAAMKSGVIAALTMLAAGRFLENRPLDRGKGRFRAYPALRGCDDAAAGFTASSIQTRLPRIVDDIIATIPSLHSGAAEELRALRLEISSNALISGLPAARAADLTHSASASKVDGDDELDWPS